MKFILESANDDHRPVYITGNFNHWHPNDERFRMNKIAHGRYEIDIDIDVSFPLEYKYTKGDWSHVEIDEHSNITHNRILLEWKDEVYDFVPRWRDHWLPYKSEFLPIVEVVSEAFEIPQLDKTRKVWALLPWNYYQTNKRFPVLYLQDAQNLFFDRSPYGNWEIDKKMAVLAEYGRGDLIIIAIEHGDEDRIKEYVFENNRINGNGDGKKYIRFVTDTLKPYIDNRYRTLKERTFTGIGGSSLGGLISIYAGMMYPEVYSKLMIFSPSLWAVPNINFPMLEFCNPFHTKIYIYGGKKEGSEMEQRIADFKNKVEQYNKNQILLEFKVSINPVGEHNEFFWGQEFPKAIEWLYFNSYTDPKIFADEHHLK